MSVNSLWFVIKDYSFPFTLKTGISRGQKSFHYFPNNRRLRDRTHQYSTHFNSNKSDIEDLKVKTENCIRRKTGHDSIRTSICSVFFSLRNVCSQNVFESYFCFWPNTILVCDIICFIWLFRTLLDYITQNGHHAPRLTAFGNNRKMWSLYF